MIIDYQFRRCPWPVPPPISEISESIGELQRRGIIASSGQGVTGAIDTSSASPLQTQIGGNHYKDLAIQPAEYNHANNIPYMEGNVIKYVTRWRKKGGIKDLEKAKHYLELLIEMETKKDKQ
jgi:hypothetical protein